MRRTAILVLSLVLASVATPAVTASAVTSNDLRDFAATRVYFGHQSVGWNVLDGVSRVYAARHMTPPVVVDGLAAMPRAGGAIAQDEIGSNGDPNSKMADVAGALAGSPDVDVAVMKFCFVDVTSGTDADELFKRYRAMVAEISTRSPGVRLVHTTVPLTTDDPKANVVRQRYNSLLRASYGQAVFDLARIESTRPDGSRVKGRVSGERYFALYRRYAADEGHLNARGSRRAALEFIEVVARAS